MTEAARALRLQKNQGGLAEGGAMTMRCRSRFSSRVLSHSLSIRTTTLGHWLWASARARAHSDTDEAAEHENRDPMHWSMQCVLKRPDRHAKPCGTCVPVQASNGCSRPWCRRASCTGTPHSRATAGRSAAAPMSATPTGGPPYPGRWCGTGRGTGPHAGWRSPAKRWGARVRLVGAGASDGPDGPPVRPTPKVAPDHRPKQPPHPLGWVPGRIRLPCLTTGLNSMTVRCQGRTDCRQRAGDAVVRACVGAHARTFRHVWSHGHAAP